MPLSPEQEAALRAAAEAEGLDPQKLITEADKVLEEETQEETTTKAAGRPVFERLLIGAFPFIKVRELRKHWLGLEERIPDDEMMCGEFAAKYGGSPASGTPAPGTEAE